MALGGVSHKVAALILVAAWTATVSFGHKASLIRREDAAGGSPSELEFDVAPEQDVMKENASGERASLIRRAKKELVDDVSAAEMSADGHVHMESLQEEEFKAKEAKELEALQAMKEELNAKDALNDALDLRLEEQAAAEDLHKTKDVKAQGLAATEEDQQKTKETPEELPEKSDEVGVEDTSGIVIGGDALLHREASSVALWDAGLRHEAEFFRRLENVSKVPSMLSQIDGSGTISGRWWSTPSCDKVECQQCEQCLLNATKSDECKSTVQDNTCMDLDHTDKVISCYFKLISCNHPACFLNLMCASPCICDDWKDRKPWWSPVTHCHARTKNPADPEKCDAATGQGGIGLLQQRSFQEGSRGQVDGQGLDETLDDKCA